MARRWKAEVAAGRKRTLVVRWPEVASVSCSLCELVDVLDVAGDIMVAAGVVGDDGEQRCYRDVAGGGLCG